MGGCSVVIEQKIMQNVIVKKSMSVLRIFGDSCRIGETVSFPLRSFEDTQLIQRSRKTPDEVRPLVL